jgi:hypothetical protein
MFYFWLFLDYRAAVTLFVSRCLVYVLLMCLLCPFGLRVSGYFFLCCVRLVMSFCVVCVWLCLFCCVSGYVFFCCVSGYVFLCCVSGYAFFCCCVCLVMSFCVVCLVMSFCVVCVLVMSFCVVCLVMSFCVVCLIMSFCVVCVWLMCCLCAFVLCVSGVCLVDVFVMYFCDVCSCSTLTTYKLYTIRPKYVVLIVCILSCDDTMGIHNFRE